MGIIHSQQPTMKIFIALCVASVVSAMDVDTSGGIYIDAETLVPICVAGSNMEAKLWDSMTLCHGDDEFTSEGSAAGRRRRPNKKSRKQKARQCPTFQEIEAHMEEEFAEEACMLMSWGWIDEEGKENNETIAEDIASLYPEISSQISEDLVEECVSETMETMMEGRKGKQMAKCFEKMDEQDQEMIEEMAMGITTFRCFMKVFNEACSNYVTEAYVNPLLESFLGATGSEFTASG